MARSHIDTAGHFLNRFLMILFALKLSHAFLKSGYHTAETSSLVDELSQQPSSLGDLVGITLLNFPLEISREDDMQVVQTKELVTETDC
jgi:hypothetical protein